MKTNPSVKEILERQYNKFTSSKIMTDDFILNDPVQFPRLFSEKADIEIAAFITACIAWGRRDLILRSAEKLFALMEGGPASFVMSNNFSRLKNRNIHRTFFESDLEYFCKGFRYCYAKYGSMENLFTMSLKETSVNDVWEGIALFRKEMAAANKGYFSKHIADPEKSACKRINLALRWLVRSGPVDLQLWKGIKPSALFIPLDVHVARNARSLGLLTRKSNDKKAVIELTENLREFCPEDPVKYDFALFSLRGGGFPIKH